jgi:hypothetical protein
MWVDNDVPTLKNFYQSPFSKFWPHCPWNIDPPTYGIMNYSLLVEMRGGSIYHEGVQNTMTKNWPWGHNTIWKIEPSVKILYVNWPRGQFTMGFKIPYDTATIPHKFNIVQFQHHFICG